MSARFARNADIVTDLQPQGSWLMKTFILGTINCCLCHAKRHQGWFEQLAKDLGFITFFVHSRKSTGKVGASACKDNTKRIHSIKFWANVYDGR
ncbi:unnamed protein product [Hermetia illucens]|uniref:Uncharacterized protein n=1 Tax=Hermetia illucens TaxID=343691 RepID=A0A7R8V3A2_HERIL|nr:unnamed protein product [Hermetia illucens]